MVNILILLITLLSLLFSQSISAQLPNDPLIVHGHAHIDVTGNHMTITNTPNTILNWQNFSIGPQDSVYFQQQDTASQILNRVAGNDPSHILGNLSSNGHVWLVNPYGVLFGPNARIDVAGLVASTLDISNIDFLASRNQFYSANNLGEVRNQGDIQTTLGGRVWLVGNQVKNEGVIQTPSGQIALAAGNSIELVDSGAPNVVVRIKAPENQTVNLGSLIASNGGNIDLHGSIVNQEGIVRANSLGTDASGHVVLKADQVSLAANSETHADKGFIQMEAGTTLNNWGLVNGRHVSFAANEILQQGKIIANGGSINLVANAYTYLDGLIDVSNLLGTGGTIQLFTGKLEGMAGGALRSDGEQGGRILVQGRDSVAFSSTLAATGITQGGRIEVTADGVYLLNADIDVSGGSQGGTVHLGGGWQGSGELPHAREVLIGVGSEVKANGSANIGAKGGEIAVWSTQSSEHYGSLQAKDSGRVELSSKDEVRQTGDIQVGAGGTVLFDPKNLIITDSPPDNLTLARKVTSENVSSSIQFSLVDGDSFGSAVALDGDRLAIGTARDDTGGSNGGAVHLFTGAGANDFAGLTWQKKLASNQGAIGMSVLSQDDVFGSSVALDGNLLAIGAPLTGNANTGSVYLFSGVGEDFSGLTLRTQLASGVGAIGMPTLSPGAGFGESVALDGGHLAVGIFSSDGNNQSNSSVVHLFDGVGVDFSGLTHRIQLGSSSGALGMPIINAGDRFGRSLALDGDRLVVGADMGGTNGNNRGAVHLFTGIQTTNFSGLTWRGIIDSINDISGLPSLVNGDGFGFSVALNGNNLVVGSIGTANQGVVHLFKGINTANFSGLTWQGSVASGTGATNMPQLGSGDRFGWSLSLQADRLVVGAAFDDTQGADRGAVHLFTGVNTNNFTGLTWQRKLASGQVVLNSGFANGDLFGISVSLDGDRMAVGAVNDDTGGINRGAVHLFTGASTNNFNGLTWEKKLASGLGAIGMTGLGNSGEFGESVALDGDNLAVGAVFDNTSGGSSGAVYLFNGVGTEFSNLTLQKKLDSSDITTGMPQLAAGDAFGESVALNNGRLAVGAWGDGSSSGAVHLFTGATGNFSGLSWWGKLASNVGGMPSLAGGDEFGLSVALEGSLLAVGALNSGGVNSGTVYLFSNLGPNFSGLAFQRKIDSSNLLNDMPNLASNDQFGISVALDNGLLAVGANNDDTGGANRGAVYLFTGATGNFSGLAWQRKLASGTGISGLINGDLFGESIALDNGLMAVGAIGDDTGGSNRGAVYLFNGLSTNSTNSIAISGATFDNRAAETSYITTQTLESQLAQGSNVVLQANNDIVIDSPINVSDTEGSGGDLTLQAGRNITFIEGINTDNGDLTVIAGDPGASLSDKDPGTPTLRINSNVNLNVGDGRVTLAAVNGNFINNNGDSAITGRWHIYADAFNTSIEGFSIASFNRHFNQIYVPGSVPDYATSGNWFLYRQAPLLFVGAGVETITYNDTIPVFKPVITGFLPGDNLDNAAISGVPVWSVAGDYSTSSRPVKGAHDVIYTNGLVSEQGYQFADDTSSIGELTVNAKTLVASNFTATSKIYDGNLSTDVDGSLSILGKVENDIVTLTGKGSFDDKNVGNDKRVTINYPDVLLDGDDKGNYVLANFDSITTVANISPKVLTAGNFVAVNKIYNDKFDATLVNGSGSSNEVISGDNVTFVGGIGTFQDKNVGTNIPVIITGVSLEGADRKNYVLGDIQSTTANISPATLTHKANPTTRFIGTELSGFTGTFDGFEGDDNLQNDVSGQLVWRTSANSASLPGSYPINAEGITARNYILVPAESNKTALTLTAFNSAIRQGTTDTSIQGTNTALLGTKAILDSASEGKVADVTTYTSASMGSGFGRLNLANMSHEDMLRLIDFRRDFKEKLFSDAIYELEMNPSLSDVPICTNLSELNLGICRISDAQREELKSITLQKKENKRIGKYKARVASLPEIERKFVVVIGIDQYADKAIPSLDNAISDASAVSQLFADKLGYEVQVIKNATRAEIIKTINQLAAEVEINDSVVVYYAGHGYLNRKTGSGYWIPADASSKDPATWISNNSISEMLTEIRSKQMVMISDSCYSGSLTKEQGVGVSGGVKPADILTKRSVVVMASGGDEPVADEGKNGHSIFAWYLMEALNNVDSWKIGTNIFERIQTDVMKSFPQTPQYGAAISAGHQIGGDYLFEFRQLERTQ